MGKGADLYRLQNSGRQKMLEEQENTAPERHTQPKRDRADYMRRYREKQRSISAPSSAA